MKSVDDKATGSQKQLKMDKSLALFLSASVVLNPSCILGNTKKY